MNDKFPGSTSAREGSDPSRARQGRQPQRKVTLGTITGVFGVKGWVKVHSDTDPRDNIIRFPHWYLVAAQAKDTNGGLKVEVVDGRTQGKNIIAKLKGYDSPEQSLELRGCSIYVNREDLPALTDGEYYWTDIIGFTVIDTHGAALGSVERLFETGANDVMVVQPLAHNESQASAPPGGKNERERSRTEILIPWVKDSVIIDVDLAQQSILVDWDPDY